MYDWVKAHFILCFKLIPMSLQMLSVDFKMELLIAASYYIMLYNKQEDVAPFAEL